MSSDPCLEPAPFVQTSPMRCLNVEIIEERTNFLVKGDPTFTEGSIALMDWNYIANQNGLSVYTITHRGNVIEGREVYVFLSQLSEWRKTLTHFYVECPTDFF